MKILITGKTSRLGRAFIDYMDEHHPGEMTVDTVSLRDDEWKHQDWSVYDAVLHLAGVTKSDDGRVSDKEKAHYYAINRDLSIDAAKKAKADGVKYFLFASTMMVYGNSAPIGSSFTIDKSTKPVPASVYGASKLDGENGILELANDAFKVAIVREPVIYGEHIQGEFHKLWLLSGKLAFFPLIDSTKSYIYEGNLCECFRQLLGRQKEGIFCPQNAEVPTVCEIFSVMRKVRKKKCHMFGHLEGLLRVMSHFTRYVNAVFNDQKYTKDLSVIDGIDYQIFSLKESVEKCRK